VLTRGNAAKLYCLNRIDELAAAGDELTILDLGCGDAANFPALLRKHGQIRYVGVEPSAEACERARRTLQGLRAEIVHARAYDFEGPSAEVVVSFSVLEHVYRRGRYLSCASRNLAPGGLVLINYDAGHFVGAPGAPSPRIARWKSHAGRALARAGYEAKYQAMVREQEFRSLVARAGLEIREERVFNTELKSVYNLLPEERREPFMARWLEVELYLNELGIEYRDELAAIFRTRNFVLGHARD